MGAFLFQKQSCLTFCHIAVCCFRERLHYLSKIGVLQISYSWTSLRASTHPNLTLYHTIPHFDALKIYSCRKHCENIAVENVGRKGEIACNKQFLLFSQYFLPYMVLIFHFKCTLKFCLQFVPIRTSVKFCRLVMS